MASNQKVIWSEGMFLQPHHLQQQDRYFFHLIQGRCADLRAYSWGVTELEVDEQALAVGKFALAHCAGILPDGTPFNCPADGALPLPIDIPEGAKESGVYLALPLRRPGMVEADDQDESHSLARYTAQELEVQDSNAGASGGTAWVRTGQLRLRLLLDSDDRDAYTCLGVARLVERRADRQVVLDEAFLPPCLDCQSVPRLAGFIKEAQGLLQHRGETLAGRVTDTGRGSGAAEIAHFLLLQTVNRLEPLFTHFAVVSPLHPEEFYRALVQAVGELATFSTQRKRPSSVPAYRHDDLQATFEPLMESLRRAFTMIPEEAAVSIPLQQKRYGVRVATIGDPELLRDATFVLAAYADMSREALRQRFPQQVKMAPVEKITELVNLQLPGIGIEALPVAPRQVPYHSGYAYFELDRSSQYWQEIAHSGGMAIHVAGEFPGIQLELWAIRE